MIYYSDILNKPVYTENFKPVGKIKDMIFYASEAPRITKLLIEDLRKKSFLIPIEYLKKINQKALIKTGFKVGKLEQNELYIKKNLLDRQIIDIKGTKVVRVNDILIQDKKGFFIAGVDVGIFGILRWFNLEEPAKKLVSLFTKKTTSTVLSWADIQPIELGKGKVILKREQKKIENIHPADLADYLEQTNIINVTKFLTELNEEFVAEIVDNLNVNYQTALFKTLNPKKAAHILYYADPDEAVDILLTLPKRKQRQIMNYLDKETRKELQYLLSLSKTPIGGLLTTEFITVSPEMRVKEVISLIQKQTEDFSFLNYIYVVNNKKQLIGVFNLHELLLQPPNTLVLKFMVPNIIVVHLSTPKHIAIKKMLKYKISAIPVIDQSKKILGIITFDDIAEDLIEKV